MQRQAIEVQTIYAELLEQLAVHEAHRTIGHLPGGFVTKSLKDHEYYYYQYLEPGGSKRQVYIGRKDDALDAAFLKGAEAQGMVQLKGHRAVGGMRASIYNAMPVEGVKALADFMREFHSRHG